MSFSNAFSAISYLKLLILMAGILIVAVWDCRRQAALYQLWRCFRWRSRITIYCDSWFYLYVGVSSVKIADYSLQIWASFSFYGHAVAWGALRKSVRFRKLNSSFSLSFSNWPIKMIFDTFVASMFLGSNLNFHFQFHIWFRNRVFTSWHQIQQNLFYPVVRYYQVCLSISNV